MLRIASARLPWAAIAIAALTLSTQNVSASAHAASQNLSPSAPSAISDPAAGPHAIDEARHADAAPSLPVATSRVLARRAGAFSLVATTAGAAASTSSTGPFLQREVFGFAPYWAISQNAQWNYTLLSTVAYFGLTVEADGHFNTNVPGWNQWNSQALIDTINRAHAAGGRAVVVVKQFYNPTINALVTDPVATQNAITNTINAIQSKGLDGVNVDFEGKNVPEYPNLQSGITNFMTQLSQQVHARWPNAEVSIDTYSGSASWDGGIFKIGDLAPVVDAMFVMAYDMPFDNSPGHAGPNAPLTGFLYNDTQSVSEYLTKAPASKILLGVPYYGYKWSTSGNQPYAAATSGATADNFANIVTELACGEPKLTRGWDTLAQSPWASWWSPATNDPCGANFNSWRELYYDNAQSLGFKYDLVNSNQLRGTGMWALSYDGTRPELWSEIALKLSTTTPWDSLLGAATTGPAAAASASSEDVLVGGADGRVWRNSWNGTAWGGWQGVGGVLTADPAAVAWGPNRLDVFIRGADGRLWHRAWNGAWGAWEGLGGSVVSGPAAASWAANRLDLFVRGADSTLWHRAWNGGAWNAWESLGGSLGSAPAAVSWGPNRIDVFVRGADGALWERAWDGTTWTAWQSLGGRLNSDPAAASCASGHVDVFALGSDGGLWRKGSNGTSWTAWVAQGGQWTSNPDAVCRVSTTTIDIFERAFDGAVWHTNVASA